VARRFVEFCDVFSQHFIVRGRDISQHARSYLSGLLGTARRKNIGRIEEDVSGSNYQAMQQLVSDSPWDHQALMSSLATQADGMLGGHRDTGLYLDESSFVKKGDASVGVQRQYCGRLGKIENCQVGVFACLGRADRALLVDFRLFLPEAWLEDERRCTKAKVPPEERRHRTKAQLALEMVRAARERGLSYRWIGGDEVFGNNVGLTDALEDLGETFLMDVASTLKVWDKDPQPQSPKALSGLGRPASAKVPAPGATRRSVAEWTAENFAAHSRAIRLRSTTKEPLEYRIWVREVWQWEKGSEQARRRLLVVRQEADGSHKYSLSNAPSDTAWERLGYMQAQRFWIERAFQDAKSELGMSQYEVRSWRGWHHHMALVCLAMLFIVKERLLAQSDVPFLSARDVVELLAIYLPRRSRDPEDVLRQIRDRHQKRARATKSYRKRRRKSVTK
jgi:SRSO17 transposase